MGEPLREEVEIGILTDDRRMAALRLVRELDLPHGAIAGDFVRCAVFDRLHGHPEPTQLRSIDVVYLDAERTDPAIDRSLELELVARAARRPWRVANLARDGGTLRAGLAARYPDTASAVAVRLGPRESLEIVAPFGLEDLVAGVVRPSAPERAGLLRRRMAEERWRARYPRIRLVDLAP